MNRKEFWQREKYVAIHGQTLRFRVVKYIVLIVIAFGLHKWGGWPAVGWTFLVLTILAIGMHCLFRWKTKAWTESWGPYKKLDLPK